MSKLTLDSLPFRREMDKVGSVTRSQSTVIGKLLQGAGAAAAVGFAAATVAAVALVVQGTKLAATNEMLATSLEVIGKNAGWEAEELYKAVEAVKEKGITTSAATKAVTLFIQAQLALGKSSEVATAEISKLARVSQDLAVVAGVNSSEAMTT
ncbi:MAG TPA: hypothetical protein VM223_22305, partial [Planctomycetota bacterium]|nr:hypothetical protein [Planctomycetota bacterium]